MSVECAKGHYLGTGIVVIRAVIVIVMSILNLLTSSRSQTV